MNARGRPAAAGWLLVGALGGGPLAQAQQAPAPPPAAAQPAHAVATAHEHPRAAGGHGSPRWGVLGAACGGALLGWVLLRLSGAPEAPPAARERYRRETGSRGAGGATDDAR